MKRFIGIGWASRLVSVALALVNTRLLVDIAGLQGLAAQAVIASMAPWAMLLNLGLPASTQNLIGDWRARGRALAPLKSTAARLALAALLVFVPVALLAALAMKRLLLADFPAVSTWSVAVACLCFLVTAASSLLTSMLYAEHRVIWPNLAPGVASIVLCGALVAIRSAHLGNVDVAIAIYFVPSALLAFASFRLLELDLTLDFDRECAHALWANARGFLLVSFLGTATLSVDYIILSRILTHEDLAAYNLSGRLFLVIPVIHAVLLAAAWTPIGDLYAKKDLRATRRTIWRVVLAGLTLALASGASTVVFAPWLLTLLSGQAVTHTALSTMLLWWAYVTMRAWSDTFYTVLQSFGLTTALRNYLFVQAPLSVGLQWLLGSLYGGQGVLVAIILSFALTCGWYLPWIALRATTDPT